MAAIFVKKKILMKGKYIRQNEDNCLRLKCFSLFQ